MAKFHDKRATFGKQSEPSPLSCRQLNSSNPIKSHITTICSPCRGKKRQPCHLIILDGRMIAQMTFAHLWLCGDVCILRRPWLLLCCFPHVLNKAFYKTDLASPSSSAMAQDLSMKQYHNLTKICSRKRELFLASTILMNLSSTS